MLAVLVLVGAGAVAVKLLGGSHGELAGGGHLAAAVTTEPEEAWTYNLSGEYLSAAGGAADLVLLADENGEVVAVDSDGERSWTNDDEYVGYVESVPGHEDLVVVAGGEGGGVGVLSTENGEQLWWDDLGWPLKVQEDGVLISAGAEDEDTSELAWVDLESGDREWSVDDVNSFAAASDSVYVVSRDTLRRLDRGSGDEDWTVDLSVDEEDYVQLAATGSFVAVSQGDQVTAYDADHADELWTVSAEDDGDLSIGAYSDDRVYVSESVYDDTTETSSTTVTVRDDEGEVGEIPVADDSYFYGTGVEAQGASWFIDLGSGEVYDDEVERAAQYDGELDLTDQGAYALESDDLAFYEYGEGKASWDMELPDSDDDGIGVYAVDDGIVVASGGKVTLYR